MLTPLDIESKRFEKQLLGFNTREVRKFLKEIISNYEVLYRENVELKDKLAALNEGIQFYKQSEEFLQKALVEAEKTSEEIRRTAREKADLIEKEAELKAEEILGSTREELNRLRIQKQSLVSSFDAVKLQVQHYLQMQLQMLEKETDFSEMDVEEPINSNTWSKAKQIINNEDLV